MYLHGDGFILFAASVSHGNCRVAHGIVFNKCFVGLHFSCLVQLAKYHLVPPGSVCEFMRSECRLLSLCQVWGRCNDCHCDYSLAVINNIHSFYIHESISCQQYRNELINKILPRREMFE